MAKDSEELKWIDKYKTAEESFQAMLDLIPKDIYASEELSDKINLLKIEYLTNLQEESGSPYIKVLEEGTKGGMGDEGRAYFSPNKSNVFGGQLKPDFLKSPSGPAPDTLAVYEKSLWDNLLAEYPHAFQWEEDRELNPIKQLVQIVKNMGQSILLQQIPSRLGLGEPIYNEFKNFETYEHEAHYGDREWSQKTLMEEYNKQYIAMLDEYIAQKYKEK